MQIDKIADQAREFRVHLDRLKERLAPNEFSWYPYGTLDNFYLIEKLLQGHSRRLLDLIGNEPIVDIGAADGDTAFFMESLGCRGDIVDFAPTNFNGCRGARALKEALGSNISIHETDLDTHFALPRERYGLAFFLGILYHLKNPYRALEGLARCARHALVSTRVVRYNLAPGARGSGAVNAARVELHTVPAAYLVDPRETNDDNTNYWMFSDAGLRRILHRCGWEVVDFMTVGNTTQSDPATHAGDERAFCLVRSRHV